VAAARRDPGQGLHVDVGQLTGPRRLDPADHPPGRTVHPGQLVEPVADQHLRQFCRSVLSRIPARHQGVQSVLASRSLRSEGSHWCAHPAFTSHDLHLLRGTPHAIKHLDPSSPDSGTGSGRRGEWAVPLAIWRRTAPVSASAVVARTAVSPMDRRPVAVRPPVLVNPVLARSHPIILAQRQPDCTCSTKSVDGSVAISGLGRVTHQRR